MRASRSGQLRPPRFALRRTLLSRLRSDSTPHDAEHADQSEKRDNSQSRAHDTLHVSDRLASRWRRVPVKRLPVAQNDSGIVTLSKSRTHWIGRWRKPGKVQCFEMVLAMFLQAVRLSTVSAFGARVRDAVRLAEEQPSTHVTRAVTCLLLQRVACATSCACLAYDVTTSALASTGDAAVAPRPLAPVAQCAVVCDVIKT